MMDAAEATLPGVVKWVSLSASTAHLVRHGLDEMAEEVTCDLLRCRLMELNEGELGRAVCGNEQLEPPFRRVNLGQIDVEVAERVGLKREHLSLSPSTSGNWLIPGR